MLTVPQSGWSDFQLDGTSSYGLSYLDDIAFEWVEQAIHGLETGQPFCVKGCLEPERFLCVVSYYNCHIICEDEGKIPFIKDEMTYELSHTSMLQFCQYLYDDINNHLEEWAGFSAYKKFDLNERKEKLAEKLAYLKSLIIKNESTY